MWLCMRLDGINLETEKGGEGTDSIRGSYTRTTRTTCCKARVPNAHRKHETQVTQNRHVACSTVYVGVLKPVDNLTMNEHRGLTIPLLRRGWIVTRNVAQAVDLHESLGAA